MHPRIAKHVDVIKRGMFFPPQNAGLLLIALRAKVYYWNFRPFQVSIEEWNKSHGDWTLSRKIPVSPRNTNRKFVPCFNGVESAPWPSPTPTNCWFHRRFGENVAWTVWSIWSPEKYHTMVVFWPCFGVWSSVGCGLAIRLSDISIYSKCWWFKPRDIFITTLLNPIFELPNDTKNHSAPQSGP